jgi:hypothetical protein
MQCGIGRSIRTPIEDFEVTPEQDERLVKALERIGSELSFVGLFVLLLVMATMATCAKT